MKLNYFDIQYIIEQATKMLYKEGRMAFVPKADGKGGSKPEYNAFYIQNDRDIPQHDIQSKGDPLVVKCDGELYELAVKTYTKKETVFITPDNNIINIYINNINTKKLCMKNLLMCKDVDTVNESNSNTIEYLVFLLNNPFHTVKINDFEYYVLQIVNFGYDMSTLGDEKIHNDIIYNTKQTKSLDLLNNYTQNNTIVYQKFNPNKIDNQPFNKTMASNFFINRYDETLNGGKGGLIYDAMNSLVEKHHGYFVFDNNKKVEYINLSHFSVDVAAFLKKSTTGKIAQRARQSSLPISIADPNDTNNPSVFDTQDSNFINQVDNRMINKDEQGRVVGLKRGDVVQSGDMLAVESAKAMAYVINEKINNLSAILSIESSGQYNKKTIGKEFKNNKDNVIYQLETTFKQNVGTVNVSPSFFKKAAHLVEISKKCQASREDLVFAYGKKLFEIMKNFEETGNVAKYYHCIYCSKGEKPEILDRNGWADFSFMNDDYQFVQDDEKDMILRTFNGKKVKDLFETKTYETHKWQIKTIPETVKKYMSFWLQYAYDSTIKNIRSLKESVNSGSGKDNENYNNLSGDEQYRMDDDTSTSGIVIFDDNFASGATLEEAARLLVEYFNINPERILCLTPGWMASK